MQSDNEKMLQEIVQHTEMGKNTLDEMLGLTHDQRLKNEMMRQKKRVSPPEPAGAHGAGSAGCAGNRAERRRQNGGQYGHSQPHNAG